MPALTLTIVQEELHWHDAGANRRMFTQRIDQLAEPTDLIILPEMFTTGFTMDAKSQAESMDGPSMDWLHKTADRQSSVVCGSLIIEDGGYFYNRFIFMRPDGSFEQYDKRHLFRLADEHQHYSPGEESIVVELNGWRICPMICYDLRFPVWSRNRQNYDLLLYVANWPSPRHHAWHTLIRARAIENLAYVAAVNRSGKDGNNLPYLGGSAIIDYLGHELVDLGDSASAGIATLDKEALNKFRDRFPFHKDADRFQVLDGDPVKADLDPAGPPAIRQLDDN